MRQNCLQYQICASEANDDDIKQHPPSIKTTRQHIDVKTMTNDKKIWMYPHKR